MKRNLLTLLILALLASAMSPEATAALHSPEPEHPNLLLITLDTTRADHLGAWGWKWAHTPNLDALARHGVRFARVDTAAPLTLPSHATILTGLYPPHHGVRDNGIFALSSGITTLAERLAEVGYDRAAVVSSVILARRYGLAQGFRIYDDGDMGDVKGGDVKVAEQRSASEATSAALRILHRLAQPFLLWVHYYDPHAPYTPPPEFRHLGGPSPLYDGEIAYMDQQIGRLLANLPADTLVLAVADHGEMLGEHGEAHHGMLPFRAARRVPLLVSGPNVPKGKEVSCLVRTADVTPTLLEAAGIPVPDSLDGKPLQPLWSGSDHKCDRPSYSEAFLPFFSYRWYPLRTLTVGRWLYLQAPTPSLYDEDHDPGEDKDLARAQPSITMEMRAQLTSLLGRMGESLEPALRAGRSEGSEERRQLESLGYVSGRGGGQVSAALPDPRLHTAEARTIQDAQTLISDDRCSEVLHQLQPILETDPDNPTAINYTTHCLLEAKQFKEALPLAAHAQRLAPRSPAPWINIARAREGVGDDMAAEHAYHRALALDPGSRVAALRLARLLLRRNNPSAAIKVLNQAIAAGVSDPRTLTERGLAHAKAGDLSSALDDFERAARKDPSDPLPLSNAARAAYTMGRFKVAADMYERLLRLRPEDADLWATLAAIYDFKIGNRQKARAAYTKAIELMPSGRQRQKLMAARERLKKTNG